MIKKAVAVITVVAMIALLAGCSAEVSVTEKPAKEGTNDVYAYVYTPEGTLLAEGCPSRYAYGGTKRGGSITICIDGVTYKTGWDNVVLIMPANN